jgi:hypothetical protein
LHPSLPAGSQSSLQWLLNKPGRFQAHPVNDVTASKAVTPSVLQ